MVRSDPDRAEERARTGARVILVRPETAPDDFHGMIVSQGILTTIFEFQTMICQLTGMTQKDQTIRPSTAAGSIARLSDEKSIKLAFDFR